MGELDSIYPLEVYRKVSDEGERLADGHIHDGELVGGTVLPPFTRPLAEAIAATRPTWAKFEDTEIGPEVRSDDHNHIYILWAQNFGNRVAVTQEVAYQWTGVMFGPAAFPSVRLWADTQFEVELASGSEARALAASLEAAGALLDDLEKALAV